MIIPKMGKTQWHLLFCCFAILLFLGCRKDGRMLSFKVDPSRNIENAFFETPPNTTDNVKRIVEQIKVTNQKHEFITHFATKYGFPVWNKIIQVQRAPPKFTDENSNSGHVNIAANPDTIILIPLVLENEKSVNGYLQARLNDSISLRFSLAQDYKNYSFSTTGLNSSEATKFAFTMIYLNKLVFGVQDYRINDYRLFSSDTVNKKTKNISLSVGKAIEVPSANFYDYVDVCSHVNVTYVNCQYTTNPSCIPVCDQCPLCLSTMQIETCISIYTNSGSSGGSGGSTGGTSGGGEIPHYYPCVGNIPIDFSQNLLPENLPPCPPPPGGNGWQPNVEPCNTTITGLTSNSNFKNKFLGLMTNVSSPDNIETAEVIYDINNTYTHLAGTASYPGFSMVGLGVHAGLIHRHFDGLNDMFSHTDIWTMMQEIVGNNVISPNDYFWGMVGPNEVPYILKIKDASKIKLYMQSHTFIGFDQKYAQSFNFPFNSQGNLSNRNNEIGILEMLKAEGLDGAIDVYRGNGSFTQWDKIGTTGRIVFTISCQ